jgi:uncharacterized protein (UPF0332 family)
MDAHDYLTLAETLVGGSAEAEWRSAVSRAYYAAFHVARRLFQQCGFTVPRAEKAHTYLAFRLTNSGHAEVQTAGRNLDILRTQRNQADYDFHHPYNQVRATAQVKVAREIIQALEAAELEPVKTQITDAMKVYERDVLKQVTWHP